MQLHARLVVRPGRAVGTYAHIAGGHPLDRAVLVEQHLGGGEARIDLDTQCLGLAGEPAAELAEADDIVAAVAHLRRRRQAKRPALGEEQEAVLARLGVERRPTLAPIGQQLVERAWLQHRAREDMGAHLGALLEDADAEFHIMLERQLLQPDRRRQPGRAGADDHHVVLHRVAFHGGLPILPKRRPCIIDRAASATPGQHTATFYPISPLQTLTFYGFWWHMAVHSQTRRNTRLLLPPSYPMANRCYPKRKAPCRNEN